MTDDVLHGELTSGDHGDCLDMDSGHVHWTRSWTMSSHALYIFKNSSVLSCQELIVERNTVLLVFLVRFTLGHIFGPKCPPTMVSSFVSPVNNDHQDL